MLAVLKNDRFKDRERKRDTEELLGTLTDERFAVLVNLGKKITDFGAEGGSAGPKAMGGPVAPAPGAGGDDDLLDETHGVNVQFQDTDDEDEEDGYEEVGDGVMVPWWRRGGKCYNGGWGGVSQEKMVGTNYGAREECRCASH